MFSFTILGRKKSAALGFTTLLKVSIDHTGTLLLTLRNPGIDVQLQYKVNKDSFKLCNGNSKVKALISSLFVETFR